MTLKAKKIVSFVAGLGALTLPWLALAQSQVQQGLQINGLQGLFGTLGLTGSQSLPQLIASVIQLMLIFAGGIAVVFVVVGGYYYITAQGNEEQAEKGKNTLINAIIGIIVVILSYVIINVIVNLVSTPSGMGF